MRGYVEANQEFALKAIKGFMPRTRTQVWLQNQMLRMLPNLPFQQVIARNITQNIERVANAITLKDYQACGEIQC